MKKKTCRLGFAGVLLLLMVFPVSASTDMDRNAVLKKVSGLQVPFIENQGQIGNESVRFYADTFAGTVYVTGSGGIVYSLVRMEGTAKNGKHALRSQAPVLKTVVLRESIVDSKKMGGKEESVYLHPVGINKAVTRVSYFTGEREKWKAGVPTWQEVNLGEAYKGIELKLRAYGKNVEKVFTVRPEGSVRDIRLRIEGADGLRVNREGELEIVTALGTVKMTRPVAYQEIDGRRVEVAADYMVPDSSSSSQDPGLTYGFRVGDYDKTRPLIIDPLLASTFLGGGLYDNAVSVVVDKSGNIYVSGGTYSSDFPTTPGAYDEVFSYMEAFVSKFDPGLEELLASTFIGPAFSCSMTMDDKGNIYVTGITPSPDFPTTPGAYDRIFGPNDPESTSDYWFYDGFISILDGDLETLRVSTYVGLQTDDDFSGGIGIALDRDGNVYMASSTLCSYVGTGIYCAVIAKFDARLENRLAYKMLPRDSGAGSVAVDSSGSVYMVGSGNNIPTTPDAYDTTPNGIYNAFISKFDGNLESILAATYLGGGYLEYPTALFIDDDGDVYVTGWTRSSDFPVTPEAFDTSFDGGEGDAFISKLDSDLKTLLASTFLGGDGFDGAGSIVMGGNGNLYVAGWTSSADFPTTPDTYDATLNGSYDAFIARFDGDLKTLSWSTYLGGADRDNANSLTVDIDGNVYVAGRTSSPDFPVTPEAFDSDYDWADAFVLKFALEEEGIPPHKHKCRH